MDSMKVLSTSSPCHTCREICDGDPSGVVCRGTIPMPKKAAGSFSKYPLKTQSFAKS